MILKVFFYFPNCRFNLFGDYGAAWSVVYVDIDAHNRNRSIFETLLPRASTSKEFDAALLPVISFPAFATHDEKLYAKTKLSIEKNLQGEDIFQKTRQITTHLVVNSTS